MTGCFIKLLFQLPNILKTNVDHKDEKLEVIQTILDGIKPKLGINKEKFLLSGVSSEYKDLVKFEDIFLGRNLKTP